VTPVVIDASAGAELVADTRRGRALARLLPVDAKGWVPEHFYAEVMGVVRRRTLIEKTLAEAEGTAAVGRLTPGISTRFPSYRYCTPGGHTGTTSPQPTRYMWYWPNISMRTS